WGLAACGGHSSSGADPVATASGTVFTGAYRRTKAGAIAYYATEVFPSITIHTFDSSGLVVVCSPAGRQEPHQTAVTQTVLMFLVDLQGKLSLQWSQSWVLFRKRTIINGFFWSSRKWSCLNSLFLVTMTGLFALPDGLMLT
ncbi:MAG: hypothetical protein ACREAC_28890, partial [Blastocatellia bacterium]